MGLLSKIRQAKRLLISASLLLMIACNRQSLSIDVQGHRGCRGLLPENTIPAFVKALDLGVSTLELDVVMSGDGKVVVSHEAILNPEICLSPAGKPIQKNEVFNLFHMPYAEIAKCDCGSLGNPKFSEQERVKAAKPLLVDVLQAVKQRCAEKGLALPKFNVEIKSKAEYVFLYHPPISEFADAVVAVLTGELNSDQFNIQSFDVLTLQYMHAVYPETKLAYLVEDVGFRTPQQIDAELEKLGFTPAIYSCYYQMLSGETVAYLHQKNIEVIPWTVNETQDLQAMLNLGVDGIITDYPDRLLQLLSK